ncbi:hypothetical protein L4D20_05775 [Vibrio kyushuensis]|uniref:hypothetical protein n=1 Tax=Vibrio kyushuensis TaxID=2910249 RepID=UPI003D0A7F39
MKCDVIDIHNVRFNKSDFSATDLKSLRHELRDALYHAVLLEPEERDRLEILFFDQQLRCDDSIRLKIYRHYERLHLEVGMNTSKTGFVNRLLRIHCAICYRRREGLMVYEFKTL